LLTSLSSEDQILPEYQISSKSDHPWQRYDLLLIFKMAAAVAQYYFRLHIWWSHSLPKVNICLQTKFRRHILIHGCHILEFYFRFQFWPYHRTRHVTGH